MHLQIGVEKSSISHDSRIQQHIKSPSSKHWSFSMLAFQKGRTLVDNPQGITSILELLVNRKNEDNS